MNHCPRQTSKTTWHKSLLFFSCILALGTNEASSSLSMKTEPKIPHFSISYMDKSISPSQDFYHYAAGNWVKENPVPNDKAIWSSFGELDKRNDHLLKNILEDAKSDTSAKPRSVSRLVGDFYKSAMDTDRLESLRFTPLSSYFAAIEEIQNKNDLFKLIANFHKDGISVLFDSDVQPDDKESSIYAFQLMQGGLSLPDRDYYLKDNFQKQREAYLSHIKKMFMLFGESAKQAENDAKTVMNIETALAKSSRSRVELRDPIKNYNKFFTQEFIKSTPSLPWLVYFANRNIAELPYEIVRQPEFFSNAEKLINEHPISDWKVYLRWHVLHGAAPFLHHEVEEENFNFFGRILKGQKEQEPRWKRVKNVIDCTIGEALGKIYVEKYFSPEAKNRMNELVNNLRVVFKEHLQKIDWMSDETKQKALLKFERFTQKIGYPEKFRDYSSVDIQPEDYFGNVVRAGIFETQRRIARLGKPVDKTEWEMTPPTVNAYFNPLMNEIVFPAGILQPPFFDVAMDDAVNYGAIAVVIGHEITHGYDDEGRHYDANGMLNEWWTEQDAKEFSARAKKIVDEYNSFEALPGIFVNGELTLGENIADLGGISIAYDALQRALKQDPTKRKKMDGLTPEQRFFISYAQIWRTNIRNEEQQRRITVDPHAPGRFRAIGPLLNYHPFYQAFGIQEGDPMWRAPSLRANIW